MHQALKLDSTQQGPDRFFGTYPFEWSERQREGRLPLLAQNSRFVILAPRQPFPNLATRALSLNLKRLSQDWQAHDRHPIVLVESFVDREYFQATAYKASGWQSLGYSSGFK
jgi:hypothetical protein